MYVAHTSGGPRTKLERIYAGKTKSELTFSTSRSHVNILLSIFPKFVKKTKAHTQYIYIYIYLFLIIYYIYTHKYDYIDNIYVCIHKYLQVHCKRKGGKANEDMFQKPAPRDWFETVSNRSKLFLENTFEPFRTVRN